MVPDGVWLVWGSLGQALRDMSEGRLCYHTWLGGEQLCPTEWLNLVGAGMQEGRSGRSVGDSRLNVR